MNDLKEQIKKLESFLEQDPNNSRLVSDLIDTQLRAGQLDQAESHLVLGKKRWPENSIFSFQSGMLSLYRGQFQDAIVYFTSLLSTDVPQDMVRYNMAWAQMAMHQPEQALETLSVLTEIPARGLLLKARALHYLGRMEEAEKLLVALEMDTELSMECKSMRALIALDNEKSEAALSLAKELLNKNPDNVEGNLVAGTLSLTDGNLSEADKCFSVVLAQKPGSGRGWLGKGLLVMLKGDFVHSAEYLERAVELMPNHLGTYNALAWAYICSGELGKAEEAAMRANTIEPRFAETQGTLAVIALMKGDKPVANVKAKLANRLSGNSFAGRFAKALLDSGVGEQANAERQLEQILNSEINNEGETLVRALTRFQQKIGQGADPEKSKGSNH
ncbi:tetratricopeptide repeat protein [Microbulbifer sp. TYP-18]|uniref:tetratricopeptide repeat protein n=1 Tax=Microbulbifer sp. TYP-18 TaxID=3230024 RepID=UPI0034C5FF01